jgi:anti-sigma regulatory factor (Ser/Thr protein kinase)
MAATLHRIIESEFVELKRLMDSTTEFLKAEGVDAQAVFRVNLTLEEIVTNVVKFGHEGDERPHPIDIAIHVNPETVEVVIIDEGREFNPVLHQRETPSEILTERTTGGLGIFLIKKLVGDMRYRREGNRNIVEVKTQRKP